MPRQTSLPHCAAIPRVRQRQAGQAIDRKELLASSGERADRAGPEIVLAIARPWIKRLSNRRSPPCVARDCHPLFLAADAYRLRRPNFPPGVSLINKITLTTALASLLANGIASAASTYYATRAAFDAANPGLTCEGLEKMDAVGTTTFTSPLSRTGNTPGIVSPGEIVPGINFV